MSAPIFYLPLEELQSISVGDTIDLTGEEGHHAKNVKRLELGEAINLADGNGLRVQGSVSAILEGGLSVKARSINMESSSTNIILVQALAKHDRDLLAIETATELGVAGVIPWSADRSIVRWKKERIAKFYAKWENVVKAAAKQARRATIPEVYELHFSKDLVKLIEKDATQEAVAIVLHESATQQLSSLIEENFSNVLPHTVYLVVGPEGGISDREVELFHDAGAKVAVLGQDILRSSTAGSAAIAVIKTVQNLW